MGWLNNWLYYLCSFFFVFQAILDITLIDVPLLHFDFSVVK